MTRKTRSNRATLLNRLRRGSGPEVAGDVIAADVGQGAQDVVVGKNILRIGTVVIPMLPAVVALLVVVAVILVAVWYVAVPATMTGLFKVAVADFGQEDAQGNVRSSNDGWLLSLWLFQNLQGELQSLPPGFQPVEVWHDSLGLTRKRATIGIISGRTPAEQRDAACKRAAEIGADVLIYGNLSTNQNPASFVPRFCVRGLRSDTGEVAEIDGSYEVGAPIPVVLPLSNDLRSRQFVTDALQARAEALSWLTAGLVYDLNGSPQKALSLFVQDEAQWPSEDGTGQEVLYYFVGREDLFLNHLPDGEAAFRKALDLAPEHRYARAHLGLGGISYTRAQDRTPTDRLVTDDLKNAIAEYQQALADARAAQDPQAELQAHFALGSAYRLDGESYLVRNDEATADARYDQAIAEVQTGLAMIDPHQYRLLAYANMVLGEAYHQKAHLRLAAGDRATSATWFRSAQQYYRQCISLADADPQDRFLAQQIKSASCEPYERDVEQALAGL